MKPLRLPSLQSATGILLMTCVVVVVSVALWPEPSQRAKTASPASRTTGPMPITFEANRGQTDHRVQFLTRFSASMVFLTSEGFTTRLGAPRAEADSVIQMHLAGANPRASAEGIGPVAQRTHYFLGNDPSAWRSNVPHYAKVRYDEVYPGIDLVYYGRENHLEYDFVVSPGADPSLIELEFDGFERTAVEDGNLVLQAAAGEIRHQKPYVYQNLNGTRSEIEGRYVANDRGSVNFRLGDYDHRAEIVIDPVVIMSTYLGGSDYDGALALTIDDQNRVWVAGQTYSQDFPAPDETTEGTNNQSPDAYVAMLAEDPGKGEPGSWSVQELIIFGGSDFDYPSDIEINQDGAIFIAGVTGSNDLPGTVDDPAEGLREDLDGFVASFEPTGTTGPKGTQTYTIRSTYNPMDAGRSTFSHYLDRSSVRDSEGSWEQVAVATVSVGVRPFDLPNERWQGQLAVFSSSANSQALSPSRWQGSAATKKRRPRKVKKASKKSKKESRKKATRRKGNRKKGAQDSLKGLGTEPDTIWVGYTEASGTLLLESCELPSDGEIVPGKVIQIRGSRQSLLRDIDMNGDMLVVALDTSSPELPAGSLADFALGAEKRPLMPPRVVGLQTMNPGGVSTALLEVDPETGSVTRGTWIGGSGDEEARDLATSNGCTVVTGNTESTDFLVTDDAPQSVNRGGASDIFVTKVCWDDPEEEVVYSTLLGGSGWDDAFGVLTGPDGREVAVGFTTGPFPVTANGPQRKFGGGPFDTYITQLYKPLLQKRAMLGAADFGARGETGYTSSEIGTIFIASAGPRQLTNLVLEDGRVTTQLGPTRVLFDGEPVPLVSAARNQISFVAPANLATKATATMIEVESDEERSNPVELPVAPANPALFALNATGTGQGAFLNLDFSVNGPDNPVPNGGFLILYGTGGGEMDPPCADGELAPSAEPLPRIKQPVRVLLDGGEATVGYAGAAPGLICGVNQYNVVDPGLSGPAVSVQICVGNICSEKGITAAFE